MLKKLHWGKSAVLASILAGFVFLIVPLQTFLANRDLFEFSFAEVVCATAPIALVAAAVLFLLIVLTGLLTGRLAIAIAVALLVCIYLETGILSIGLPPLDGDLMAFDNPFRKLIDSLVLGIVFLAMTIPYKHVFNLAHWIALVVLVLGVASLFDASPSKDASSHSNLSQGFCPQFDVVESVRFSPKRNVIMLVLDSTPAVMASEIVRKEDGLRSHFPGFTAYENNMAMHEMTSRGLPGLMTGKFLPSDMSSSDYAATMFGNDSLLMPYVATNDPVYFSGQLQQYGYTNRRLGDFTKVGESLKKTGSVLFRNSSDIPYVSLYDVTKLRILPYALKYGAVVKIYYSSMKKGVRKNWGSESYLYPLIANHPLGNEDKTSLCVLHTTGIHGPITMDRDGKPLQEATQELSAHYEYGVFLMRRVADFMDGLRKKGVYDNSLIILAADHGLIRLRKGGLDADGSDGHGAESSILWIKPIGAIGEFAFSGIPTSNCRIAELVKQSEMKNLTKEEIDAIIYTKERHFYAKHGLRWWSFGRRLFFYEWVYDENGKLISYEDKGIYKAN